MDPAASARITDLLKKTEHYDSDERFMAIHDLIGELEKVEGMLEAKQQIPIRTAILRLLDDKAPDVSTVATKCLSTLVQKCSPEENVILVSKLGDLIVDPDKANRDTWADGLKTIIGGARNEDGKEIATNLSGSLLRGLRGNIKKKPTETGEEDISMEMTCLDVLKDLLERFRNELEASHKDILDVLIKLLGHANPELRKRVNLTLGALVPALAEEDFARVIEHVISKIEAAHKEQGTLYTYIQSVGVISTAAGLRVGSYLPKIIPKLMEFLPVPEDHKAGDAGDMMDIDEQEMGNQIELWENSLQSFESIILRCPQEVTAHIPRIVKVALWYMAWDPQLADESGTADAMEQDAGDDFGADDGGWGDDSGFGGGETKAAGGWGDTGEADDIKQTNDDDTSWRIRRAAVGVLSAFIRARSDIIKDYYSAILDKVVTRFKERDSNVKEEVLLCCKDLLHEAVVSKKDIDEKKDKSLSVPVIVRQRSTFEMMDAKVEMLVKHCGAQYKTAKVSTKRAIFAVLRELVIVRHQTGDLSDFLPLLIPNMLEGVTSKDLALKADALGLLHLFLAFHDARAMEPFVRDIARATCESVDHDTNPRTQADGLRVLGSVAQRINSSFSDIIVQMYKSTFGQLVLKDIDESVKEASISTASLLVANFADVLRGDVNNCLPVLAERLSNDVTRIPALEGLTRIANSQLHVDLKVIVASPHLAEIASFLRKQSTDLKQATATALEALIRSNGAHIKKTDLAALLPELSPHIGDADLQLTHLILDVLAAMVTANPDVSEDIARTDILSRVLQFSISPLLQGASLTSLMGLYQAFVENHNKGKKKAADLSFEALLKSLTSIINAETGEQSLLALAQCVAAMSQKLPAQEVDRTVSKFEGQLESKSDDYEKTLALLVLGQIGRERDLSDHKHVDEVVFTAFSSKSNSIRRAAAYAYGNITMGNKDRYLPKLLSKLSTHADQRYLLFSALKEILTRHSTSLELIQEFFAHVSPLMPILFEHAESKDEGVREMVAECIGRAAIINPVEVFPMLVSRLKTAPSATRGVVISSVRFALGKDYDLIQLRDSMPEFLALLKDPDLSIRRQAMLTVNAVAKTNIRLIQDDLKDDILPVLYAETKVNQELIELRDYGAFKEKIDHGLPSRKAAYQCLQTVMEEAPHKLAMHEYIDRIRQGLEEESYDIQHMVYNIVWELADSHPGSLLESLNDFPKSILIGIKPLLKIVKDVKTGPDREKAVEMVRHIVRTVYRFMAVPGVEQATQFIKFFKQIKATASILDIVAEVEAEMGSQVTVH